MKSHNNLAWIRRAGRLPARSAEWLAIASGLPTTRQLAYTLRFGNRFMKTLTRAEQCLRYYLGNISGRATSEVNMQRWL
jgi:hypothetical protein